MNGYSDSIASLRRAAALALACGTAFAQVPAQTLTQVPIVITATRTPVAVLDLVAEVTVLDRATLERSEGRTLVEVLAQAAGLQFSANGGLGKPSSLFVRGLEARHVLLLVDGVRVGSATLNTASFDNLPLDAVERIEIVRGPMTSVYGSNAMAGVIQVFTRRGAPGQRGNARVAIGSRGYGVLGAGLSFGAAGLDIAAQVQSLHSDGFSATGPAAPFGSHNGDADGFRQSAGSLRAAWSIVPGWQLDGLLLESRGTTQYDDGPGADARAALRTRIQSLQLAGPLRPGWRTQIALARSLDSYDTLSTANAFTDLGATQTDQRQLSWEHRIVAPLGEALLVLERVQQEVSRPGAAFERSRRHIDALAAGWSATLQGHSVQASLRHDRNSQFGGHGTGALAYAYAWTPAWRTGAAYGTSFTAPSFNQLYFPGFGTPSLQPEQGRHGELFAHWSGPAQTLRLTAHGQRFESFISSGPRPANIPAVKIDGLSLTWDARIEAWTLSGAIDRVDARNATQGAADFGRRLPRRAPLALKAGAHRDFGRLQLGAALQGYSQRFDDNANSVRLAGYGLLDLHADWTLSPDWSLGLRLNNLGAKVYETAFGYNQPGREAFLSLRWRPR